MIISDIVEKNACSLKNSPTHKKICFIRKSLSKNLIKSKRRILLKIVDEYDLLLDDCSEQNYKKGPRDGFSLAEFLLKVSENSGE